MRSRGPRTVTCVGVLLLVLPSAFTSNSIGLAPGDETVIAADMAILTEISNLRPFTGQQISVVYRLLTRTPPAAVDIDTQQFPGFWTEMLALPGEPRQATRIWQGKTAFDFLLKQVVAYPMVPGERQIPSLSVKIKRALGLRSPAAEDWDLQATSNPISVFVRPLPEGGPWSAGIPLVGEVEGRLSASPAHPLSVILDLQSSANLALFDPREWLRIEPGIVGTVTLVASERLAQTIDAEGRRQLSVKYRQQWRISLQPLGNGKVLVHDSRIPFFLPEAEDWSALDLEANVMEGDKGRDLLAAQSAGPQKAGKGSGLNWFSGASAGTWWITIAALLVLAGLVSWKAARRKSKGEHPETLLHGLEKKRQISQRAFLESAHRFLNDLAQRRHRLHDIGARDECLDRCWILVERCRFNPTAANREALDRIFLDLTRLIH